MDPVQLPETISIPSEDDPPNPEQDDDFDDHDAKELSKSGTLIGLWSEDKTPKSHSDDPSSTVSHDIPIIPASGSKDPILSGDSTGEKSVVQSSLSAEITDVTSLIIPDFGSSQQPSATLEDTTSNNSSHSVSSESPMYIIPSLLVLLLHTILHTMLMQCQMTVLLICITSKSVSMVSLMISTRFKILKKVVLRRQGDRTIFQSFLADSYNRFTTLLYLVLVSTGAESWIEFLPDYIYKFLEKLCDQNSWIDPSSIYSDVVSLNDMIFLNDDAKNSEIGGNNNNTMVKNRIGSIPPGPERFFPIHEQDVWTRVAKRVGFSPVTIVTLTLYVRSNSVVSILSSLSSRPLSIVIGTIVGLCGGLVVFALMNIRKETRKEVIVPTNLKETFENLKYVERFDI
ncbi:Tapt1 family like protein [Aduncisulcus paluster]|uniref:Tapt1 family like protein n=1 Tax=Aduncisulcus paluster TaxID=2918883 RepID=A0ABQ5KIX7_9EUKA|nr:Tapt1 family like protein [Aduncisulcus paluster]